MARIVRPGGRRTGSSSTQRQIDTAAAAPHLFVTDPPFVTDFVTGGSVTRPTNARSAPQRSQQSNIFSTPEKIRQQN
jgi:hypothetical protein